MLKLRSIFKASIVVAATAILFCVNRPTTHFPLHPYQAAEFNLPDLTGKLVRLSDFRGRAVVLNFWASWCAPCREEIPWLIEFQRKYSSQGLQIIGVDMDDEGGDPIDTFVHRAGINYIVLRGDAQIKSLYSSSDELPMTYYISSDGRVRAFVNGVVGKAEIERNIEDVLAPNLRR